jgi:N-acetylglucosaminyldiphosphoundecaprenol N-acetyl-beta-D-mannosaminyltransferase
MDEASSPALRKYSVLGVGINATSYGAVVDRCSEWINERHLSNCCSSAKYICVTSVHGVMMAQRDSTLRSIVNHANLATPDGMPIVWALRSFGRKGQQRVYGPDLMLALCQRAAEAGHRIFLYGSRPETLHLLEQNLRTQYPQLNLVGSYPDPFHRASPEEESAIRTTILESNCDLLFVGIGEPKQNRWMADHLTAFPGVVMLGVGAAFDFHAGCIQQAPEWIQRSGLEWLFRLLQEPKRLWRRYLLITPWFLPRWGIQWLKMHCFRLSNLAS